MHPFLEFWGKAQPVDGAAAQSHPIVYHLLDVAATVDAILSVRPLTLARGAHLLGLSLEETRQILVAIASLHDLGKFAPAFQAKCPAHWPEAALGAYSPDFAVRRPHTEDGFVLWDEVLSERLDNQLWNNGRSALDVLASGVFGHHGRPVGSGLASSSSRQRFGANGLAAAVSCADAMTALVMRRVTTPPPSDRQIRAASWWVSGLITLADWIGSNQRWFPYAVPNNDDGALERYWHSAKEKAQRAVREAGVAACIPSAPCSFVELTKLDGDATPAQVWAERVALPDGPMLIVIEDITGSGKTEAAQMLVHRLMTGGRASGAYWAMPTMATANAMYDRQAGAIDRLYARDEGSPRPSLVLAHGQQKLHEGFRKTVLFPPGDAMGRTDGGEDLEATVACASFLADDRRAALLADVGAGTIDQALLAALPSKFNTMRLFGLADKVLVIDEAHAYDAYMRVELQELLRFQAALGGSAIILSATLAHTQREALARAWGDGIQRHGRRGDSGANRLTSSAYPLATVMSKESGVSETPIEAAKWSQRRVGIRLMHEMDDVLQYIVDSAARGAAVAWVRNTVDDCLRAAAHLRERGMDPLVFHARFAQGDRQAREEEVKALFGKGSAAKSRRGRVLIATQVIEQSLDLDFDAMVSDIAPVDLLIQRAGRMQRHPEQSRPEGLERELVVLSPVPAAEPPSGWLSGEFAGTAYIYADAGVLWRTVQTLARTKCIETPGGLRDLIESVYGSDDVPPALLASANRAEGKAGAHAAAATYAVLKPADGYHAGAVAWLSDMRVPTRLGDPRTTLRLARSRADGALNPWTSADGPPWKAWALSEVNVSAYRVPPGSQADERYTRALAGIRATWGQFEQEIPVLPLTHSEQHGWTGTLTSPDGKLRQFAYSNELGLLFVT
jgi:CRISPR-associated endonuclease/helicase Cas3